MWAKGGFYCVDNILFLKINCEVMGFSYYLAVLNVRNIQQYMLNANKAVGAQEII